MIWLKHYAGSASNLKLTAAAQIARTPRAHAVAARFFLLEVAAEASGSVETLHPAVLAAALGGRQAVAERLTSALTELGMTQDGRLTTWEQQQEQVSHLNCSPERSLTNLRLTEGDAS